MLSYYLALIAGELSRSLFEQVYLAHPAQHAFYGKEHTARSNAGRRRNT